MNALFALVIMRGVVLWHPQAHSTVEADNLTMTACYQMQATWTLAHPNGPIATCVEMEKR